VQLFGALQSYVESPRQRHQLQERRANNEAWGMARLILEQRIARKVMVALLAAVVSTPEYGRDLEHALILRVLKGEAS